MQTLREQGLGEKAIISSYTLTKGESSALLRKCAVESTTLAQPFCVNQTVGLGDLSQRLHAHVLVVRLFPHWYAPGPKKTLKFQSTSKCIQNLLII